MTKVYTISMELDLPKRMGSAELLEDPNILELVKTDKPHTQLNSRYAGTVYIHQWKVVCGILHQEVVWMS